MILSKLFTGLGIGLTRIANNKSGLGVKLRIFPWQWKKILANPQFRATSWRLLLSYLMAMMIVMGLSSVVVYHFFAYSLYEQVDTQLLALADAAAHNLSSIRTDIRAIHRKMPRILDNDGDLDIPWQDLRLYRQSVEWFDAKAQLLGKAGKTFPDTPIVTNFHSWQDKEIRTLTIPVYSSKHRQHLLGYVRVSISTVDVEKVLSRLLMGLEIAGILGTVLVGGTSWWLTARALQPIEQNFQQLQQFTADASHELRSPLTAIKTSVELIQSHPERIHPLNVKQITTIDGATRQMTSLVEDLLLLARSDAGSTTLPKTAIPIPIDEILMDLIDVLQPYAEAKEITLEPDFTGEVWVKGDARQLQRLFTNLLENALQYTPQGGFVRVKMVRLDNSVIVEVADTGIGIAPEHLPLVFDRFWRADKARSRRQGGSGLGLSIAQAITNSHGGTITVTSQVDVGSRFQVKLPVI
ncbi:MAG: HAMP domain-containing sensor histidine kinase [Scytonema sp. PMC 1069.18]|nr:HAMP domain-containing sensor histidine kinase [Scytonema sp. PMC 1069.18]MEC4882727.1 HAMP domain-containing sensor histidine kinase [Scytonema sp. PMC 1070.18]